MFLAGGFAHVDGLCTSVDAEHLCMDAHIEVEPSSQTLRCLYQQLILFGNLAADEIWQAAVRKRNVRTALEYDDL